MQKQYKRIRAGEARVKFHLVYLTEDIEKAILLDKLMYYGQFGEDLSDVLEERIAAGEIKLDEAQVESTCGWVRRSAKWYEENALPMVTTVTISRKLTELVTTGLVEAKSDTKPGTAIPYRARVSEIIRQLAALGYTLSGDMLSEVKAVNGPDLVDPPKPAHQRTTDDAWNAIPGVPKAVVKPKTKAEEVKAVDEGTWCAKQRLLDHAPAHIRHLSWLVYQETGHEPKQHKTWISEVEALNRASQSNESHLLAGLRAGEKAKHEGITLKSPRSYLSYVISAVATANKPGNDGRDVLHNQSKVFKNGEDLLVIGGRRKAKT